MSAYIELCANCTARQKARAGKAKMKEEENTEFVVEVVVRAYCHVPINGNTCHYFERPIFGRPMCNLFYKKIKSAVGLWEGVMLPCDECVEKRKLIKTGAKGSGAICSPETGRTTSASTPLCSVVDCHIGYPHEHKTAGGGLPN